MPYISSSKKKEVILKVNCVRVFKNTLHLQCLSINTWGGLSPLKCFFNCFINIRKKITFLCYLTVKTCSHDQNIYNSIKLMYLNLECEQLFAVGLTVFITDLACIVPLSWGSVSPAPGGTSAACAWLYTGPPWDPAAMTGEGTRDSATRP